MQHRSCALPFDIRPLPEPLKDGQPRKLYNPTAGAGCAALVGILLLLISVGPLIILLNGGYSIQGMAWLSGRVGSYGKLFWAVATVWAVDVPIAERAGLPLAQPVIP